ncbi:MAG: hypothetical protein WAV20_26535 [Blastocatellia bacterium]
MPRSKIMKILRRATPLSLALCIAWSSAPARAQLNNFSSGSTGADGAFSPTTSQTVQLPESGVFNFTTVNIPTGVTITYTRNSRNTAVTLLAAGDVTIAGTINVSGGSGLTNGGGGRGGPGGFDGGVAGFGFETFVGATGDGPGGGGGGSSTAGTTLSAGGGGGYASPGGNGGAQAGALAGGGGPKYGSSTILPLIGGSGGGGGGAVANNHGGAGGGGGGAVLIACSTSISFTGTINASGGPGVNVGTAGAAGGGGSGGAIRLISNTITGAGTLNVSGANGGGQSTFPGGGNGAAGFVRIEAFNFSSFNPNVPTNSATFSLPNPLTITNGPTLRIASVAGVAPPLLPVGSLAGPPDIVVPSSATNPVTVAIEAANIPVGTVVQVSLIPLNGVRTNVQTGPLSGTTAASTASATLSLPSGMSVLTASVVVDVSTQAVFVDGEQVNRVEIAATYNGSPKVTYVTQSGRRINTQ